MRSDSLFYNSHRSDNVNYKLQNDAFTAVFPIILSRFPLAVCNSLILPKSSCCCKIKRVSTRSMRMKSGFCTNGKGDTWSVLLVLSRS